MTQEEKELLLKDLCARLPYRVKVYNTTFKEPTIQTLYGKISNDEFSMEETYTSVGVDGDDFGFFNKRHYTGYVDFIKPYLRPMSSMTEEEEILFRCELPVIAKTDAQLVTMRMELFLKGNLDFNHLIEKGLAIEAPEGMYNLKER